jgi:lysophosphatidylcholine acyltransferase/lyso-PAF acetyltransferase
LRQAAPEEAPILCVAPHSTFFDALAVAVMGAPSVVAKAETRNIPFFGSLIR